jgi:hypothetical protein
MNGSHTDFLTAKSSLWTGMGTVMNLAGNYFIYNVSPTAADADRRAIASDWRRVAGDIFGIIDKELQNVKS